MKAINFEKSNRVYGKGQPEYAPLPVHVDSDEWGHPTTSCWSLGLWERLQVLFTGKVWLTQLTFDQNLQPVRMTTVAEEAIPTPPENTLDKGVVEVDGSEYWYERKEAVHAMSVCMDTEDPRLGFKKLYLFDARLSAKGKKVFVVTRTDNDEKVKQLLEETYK